MSQDLDRAHALVSAWIARDVGDTTELARRIAALLREERRRCARALCWRCEQGHAVYGEGEEWWHGTDTIEGVRTYPPEACDAAGIWGMGE